MFPPHPEVIIEQEGVDGGLQVEGGRDKTLSSVSQSVLVIQNLGLCFGTRV